MTKMSTEQKRRLKSSDFAYPKERKYPLHDKAHARGALILAAQKGTAGDLATVKKAVKKRYPDLVNPTKSG